MLNIKILHPKLGVDWKLPHYATSGAVGMDLVAALEHEVVITPGNRMLIPCGFSMSLPPGYEAQVRPRSGLAIKNGITVLNTPGTIDPDYRGQVCVVLLNTDHNADFVIKPGDRIAQMVINKVEIATINIVDNLDETNRGVGGFGSTGV